MASRRDRSREDLVDGMCVERRGVRSFPFGIITRQRPEGEGGVLYKQCEIDLLN